MRDQVKNVAQQLASTDAVREASASSGAIQKWRRALLRGPLAMVVGALATQTPAFVHAAPPDSILIRNVRLIDVNAPGDDAVVTLVIKGGRVDFVTKDEVATTEAAQAFDARHGFLIGTLRIGEPATFLILDADPREDVDVLLDTNRYAVFAIRQGSIVRNLLATAVETEEKPKESEWLGYTPPPMALPLTYRDATKWNRWETRYVSGIFIAVALLDRQFWPSQDDASEQQVGDLKEFASGEIRGFRFGSVGTLNFKRPWVYTLFLASTAFDRGFDAETDESLALYDVRLDIPLGGDTILSVGKQKEPISMERLTSLIYLPMTERGVIGDALLPSRNVGLNLHGTAASQRMTWAGGVFNTGIQNGLSLSDGATQVVGRLTALPFLSEDESNLLHLGLGARYSDMAQEVRGYSSEPEFENAPRYVDTGLVEARSTMTYSLEASWRKGPYWLAGEYLRTDLDLLQGGTSRLSGYHVTASWAVTGEMRPYRKKGGIIDRLPVSRSVYQRGKGAVELALRFSTTDLSDGMVDGGEMDVLSLGVNWWPSPFWTVSVNLRDIHLDRLGLEGKSRGVTVRVALSLE
jgi:phosphate-selective porin OprO/OprP